MITRIVRMEFQPEMVSEFLKIFNQYKEFIRNAPGVTSLELHRDDNDPYVFYTYSTWESRDALTVYRESRLFRTVWPKTKALFSAPPQAFSLRLEMEVEP